MDKISALREKFEQCLAQTVDLTALDKVRVDFLGKKGSVTALLKGMKDLSHEEKKSFGAEVNKLKAYAAKRIEEKIRSIRTDITAAKIYIHDDKLNADIYVQDPAVYDDPEVRKSLIDELNGSISKFERIDKCNIISSLQMMK